MKIVGKERPGGIIERLNKVPALEKFIENVMENLDGELVYGDHRTDLSVVHFLALWGKKTRNKLPGTD